MIAPRPLIVLLVAVACLANQEKAGLVALENGPTTSRSSGIQRLLSEAFCRNGAKEHRRRALAQAYVTGLSVIPEIFYQRQRRPGERQREPSDSPEQARQRRAARKLW
jgi:hypothetical protein